MPWPIHRTVEEKFASLIVKQDNGCWHCLHINSGNGYGRFVYCGQKYYAHRFSWEMHIGPIPEGLHVLHKCDNPACCNPDHLFVGTQADNAQDKIAKGRDNPQKGENAGRAILKNEDVLEIRRLLSIGYTLQLIADLYGVGSSTVRAIKDNKSWRHI